MDKASLKYTVVWKRFRQQTTAHGVPHVDNATSTPKRIFWSFVFLGCLVFLAYHIATVSIYYASRPVSVSITLMQGSALKFPAVTMCNMNPVKSSALSSSPALESVLSDSKKRKRKRRAVDDIIPTYGGNGTFDICVFPFDYNGITYETCTTLDRGGLPWCATTANYTQDALWGYCIMTGSCPTSIYESTTGEEICYWNPTGETEYSYYDAKQQCSDRGGALFVIDDFPKQQHVIDNEIVTDSERTWTFLERTGADWYFKGSDLPDWSSWSNWQDPTPPTDKFPCAHLEDSALTLDNDKDCNLIHALVMCELILINGTQLTTQETTLDITTTADETTVAETTSTVDMTTSPDVTTKITTLQETTTLGQTTAETTSTVDMTTSPDVTTKITTLQETTTPGQTTAETTSTVDMTTSPDVTTKITTLQETTTPGQTTAETTSTVDMTTSPDVTTKITTLQETTTPGQTTATLTSTTIPTTTTYNVPDSTEYIESFSKREEVLGVLANMAVDEKQKLGYRREEFILECEYAGFECDPSLFTFFYDPMHGNCYTFNSGWNSSLEILTSNRPGRRYGFKINLNVNQNEYIVNLGEAAGVSVVVHDQAQMPFPQDDGILAPPGILTSIGINMVEIERLSEPYGICIDPALENRDRNVFEEKYPVNYTVNGCLKTCYQKQMIDQCGCADPQFPSDGEAFENKVVEFCSTELKDECGEKIRKSYSENADICDCPSSCSETLFITDVSMAQWPSKVFEATVATDVTTKLAGSSLDFSQPDVLRENLLTVEVFFQEFSYENIKEKPGYLDASYFSDLGGILGLWIGCSVLSLFEFFELLVDFAVALLFCCGKSPKISSDDMDNSSNKVSEGRSPPPPYSGKNRSYHYANINPTESNFLLNRKLACNTNLSNELKGI